jgi:hypothetical protein
MADELNPNPVPKKWKDRYEEALTDRQRYEGVWKICSSFLEGRQWIGVDKATGRQLVTMPNPDDRVRVTINKLTKPHDTFKGKLLADDFCPDFVFEKTGERDQAVTKHVNAAFRYGWKKEFEAASAVKEAIDAMLTQGTSGIHLRVEANWGKEVGEFPLDAQGQPIYDKAGENGAYEAVSDLDGPAPKMAMAREPRLVMDGLDSFGILPPPGVKNPDRFPWLIIIRPVPVSWVKTNYGVDVKEEKIDQTSTPGLVSEGNATGGTPGSSELKGHTLLKTGYEAPTSEYPNGCMVVWAGETMLAPKKGEKEKPLPVCLNGRPAIPAVFFRFKMQRSTFWGQGMIEPMVGPQRSINRRESQTDEIIDRTGLGRIIVDGKNAIVGAGRRQPGTVAEIVEVRPGTHYQETQGTGPGSWLGEAIARANDNLNDVSSTGDVSLGNQPPAGTAYSTLALQLEQENRRAGPILGEIREQIDNLALMTLDGMKRYWMPQKHYAIEGEDGVVEADVFNKTEIPELAYIARPVNGAPMPTSPAAQIQKTFDFFNACTSAGQVQGADWLYESITAGRMLPLDKKAQNAQQDKAHMENALIARGIIPAPSPDEPDELHAQIHSAVEAAWSQVPLYAEPNAPDGSSPLSRIAAHKQLHVQSAASKAQSIAPTAMAPQPGIPGQGTPAKPMQGNGRDAGFGPVQAAQASLAGQSPNGSA